MMRTLCACLFALAAALPLAGCLMRPAPPGQSAPMERVAPGVAPSTSGRWSGPERAEPSPAYDLAGSVTALRATVAQRGPIRTVVYFNERLSERIASWQANERGVIEANPYGEGRSTLMVYTQRRYDAAEGRRNFSAWLTDVLEQTVSDALLGANVTVIDKGLLYRHSAVFRGLDDLAVSEVQALASDVDMLVEVTFRANPQAAEGYDVTVRALRTRDAQVLARATTAGHHRTPTGEGRLVARSGGFERVEAQNTATLEYLTQYALGEAMRQVAQRY